VTVTWKLDSISKSAQLCQAGKQAELERRIVDARRLFAEAWNAALDDYDGAIAAHAFARLELDALVAMPWHQRALETAYRDERTKEFRATLHASLGACYAALGEPAANEQFEIAARLALENATT
jgi:uncharacterized protein YfiM (DUF2279 family)